MTETFGPHVPSQAPLFRYAYLDATGLITSHGQSGTKLPPAMATNMGAVLLTPEQFALISGPGEWTWNDGDPQLVPPPPPVLATVQAQAYVAIDAAAELARQQFLTRGAGQAMEYQATQLDAERAARDPEALTAEGYPWLEAERKALARVGQTVELLQVAQIVLQQMAAWTQVGAAIKEIRRSAKLQIEKAESAAEVQAILAGITWPQGT